MNYNRLTATAAALTIASGLFGCGNESATSNNEPVKAPYAPVAAKTEAKLKFLASAACAVDKAAVADDQVMDQSGHHLNDEQSNYPFNAQFNGLNGRYNEIQYGYEEPTTTQNLNDTPKYPSMGASLSELERRECPEYAGAG